MLRSLVGSEMCIRDRCCSMSLALLAANRALQASSAATQPFRKAKIWSGTFGGGGLFRLRACLARLGQDACKARRCLLTSSKASNNAYRGPKGADGFAKKLRWISSRADSNGPCVVIEANRQGAAVFNRAQHSVILRKHDGGSPGHGTLGSTSMPSSSLYLSLIHI